jgi:hypothetical protein
MTGFRSAWGGIHSGVPQGTKHDPWLFNIMTRNTCMQQPLAYILQILFQHEVFVITPTLNAGSLCLRHVCHGNTIIFAAVGSTLFLTTDFDVMTRASFLDRVITMQLDSKYRRNLVFCQSVIARKSP